MRHVGSLAPAFPARRRMMSLRLYRQPRIDATSGAQDVQREPEAGRAFAATRESVFDRDESRCQYCGFVAHKWQEVHHLNGDHSDSTPVNLVTVCNLCHQVHHCGQAGARQAGFVAVIPELTQTEVNHIARAHFVIRTMVSHCADAAERRAQGSVAALLESVYGVLESRMARLNTPSGVIDISDPAVWHEVVCRHGKASAEGAFDAFRLVPTQGAFRRAQLDYYARSRREAFEARVWRDALDRVRYLCPKQSGNNRGR